MLIDIETGTHRYVDVTEDLHARPAKHNRGEVPHTATHRPWRLQTAIAFDSKEKACIGSEESEKLTCTPQRFYVKVI
jgi:predicted GIY-YIG superfamily endonuclease